MLYVFYGYFRFCFRVIPNVYFGVRGLLLFNELYIKHLYLPLFKLIIHMTLFNVYCGNLRVL